MFSSGRVPSVPALVATGSGFMRPEMVVANDQARLRIGSAAVSSLCQQIVEWFAFHIRFDALRRIDHNIGSVLRAMAALRRRPKPVMPLRRHEDELSASVG